MSDVSFAARLVFARHQQGLSQESLADKAGMKPAAISHFETGGRKPSLDNLRKLSDALQVTADFLLGRVDEMDGLVETADVAFRNGYEQLTAEQREAALAMFQALGDSNRRKAERKRNG